MYPVSITESDRPRLLRLLDRRLDRSGGPDSCWPWQGQLHDGYGEIRANGHRHNASRVIFAVMVGDVPADMHVLHHCDHRACGNHTHMFLGTNLDNHQDMWAKGRGVIPVHVGRSGNGERKHYDRTGIVASDRIGDLNPMRYKPECRPRGAKNGGAKLTETQVIEIRALAESGVLLKDLAVQFGISPSTIGRIVSRRKWTHI